MRWSAAPTAASHSGSTSAGVRTTTGAAGNSGASQPAAVRTITAGSQRLGQVGRQCAADLQAKGDTSKTDFVACLTAHGIRVSQTSTPRYGACLAHIKTSADLIACKKLGRPMTRTNLIRALGLAVVCSLGVATTAGAARHRPRPLRQPPISFCAHVTLPLRAVPNSGFWFWRRGTDPTGEQGCSRIRFPSAWSATAGACR